MQLDSAAVEGRAKTGNIHTDGQPMSVRRGPLDVKFVLPALTEATSPYWRPIKYSLFPPLGLATLAAFLSPDDHAVIVDEHVQTLDVNDRSPPTDTARSD